MEELLDLIYQPLSREAVVDVEVAEAVSVVAEVVDSEVAVEVASVVEEVADSEVAVEVASEEAEVVDSEVAVEVAEVAVVEFNSKVPEQCCENRIHNKQINITFCEGFYKIPTKMYYNSHLF